jgi:hypothetical protein
MQRIMEKNHPHLWTRSEFSDYCKVDYINNNISESFNNWVRSYKDLQILEMHDMIRQKIYPNLKLAEKLLCHWRAT